MVAADAVELDVTLLPAGSTDGGEPGVSASIVNSPVSLKTSSSTITVLYFGTLAFHCRENCRDRQALAESAARSMFVIETVSKLGVLYGPGRVWPGGTE